jgi:crotonobetainyl-CoA:carnitine CoA-transferase CaiB-like acyl-CoA transferase
VRRVLSDLSVVELAGGGAGSYCGKLFADLGADVIRVERPGPDPSRRAGGAVAPSPPEGAYLHLNTNKRGVVIDPGDPAGMERVWRLLEGADLVIQESGTGAPAGFELAWDEVHQRVPALVMVSISGFGSTGPYAGYKWSDLIAQTLSGTLLLQNSEQDPLRFPGQVALCFVGNMAAVGGLAAVLLARSGDPGSFVDCAAVDALVSMPSRATVLLGHQYRGGASGAGLLSASRETLIPTGVFPCADGYMAMMSTPQQLGEMLEVLDSDELREAFARPDAFERGDTKEAIDAALYPWLLSHTRAEATAEAQAVGWPLAGVNSLREVLSVDHLHQRSFWVHTDDPRAGSIDLPGPPFRHAEGGWSIRGLAPVLGENQTEVADDPASPAGVAPRPPAATIGDALARPRSFPLEGIRVLDMTTVWAGPYATMLLADLGAEVIRVENPFVLPPTTKGYHARPLISDLGYLGSGYGPIAPGRPDRPWNRHALNNSISRNKLSCAIDTRQPEGRELLMRLAAQSDLFVENFKASGLARMGISVSELQARNPRLIILRMPPAGTTGDWSGYAGFGAQFDGLTGFLSLCGHIDSDLTTSPATTYMDAASGPAGALAAITALHYRSATGRGQLIELAQSENVINHLGDVFVDCQLGVTATRMGNRDRQRAPQGLYRGAGGWLAISVGTDEEWAALAAIIGGAELGRDPRFVDAGGRRAHHDALDELLSKWANDRDYLEAFHLLQQHGVPAAPLLDDAAFASDPHIIDRGSLRPLTTTDVGTHPHPGHPYRGVPQQWRRGSPGLGEDNEYVYKTILNVTDEEFERYRKLKIVAEDYLKPDGEPF